MEEYRKKTLRDYLTVIFRHKIILITTMVTVITTVFWGLIFKTPVYEAHVKMLISGQKQLESSYYRDLTGYGETKIILTQSEIVKSSAVIGLAVRALGLYQRPLDYEKNYASIFKKPFIVLNAAIINHKLNKLKDLEKKELLYRAALKSLKQSIGVESVRDTNIFVVSVKDYSPLGAVIMANTISRAYIIFDLQQQLAELQLKYGEKHPTTIQLKDNIEKISKNLNGQPLSDEEAIGPASVKIIEQADIPTKPIGPAKTITFLLACVMSVFLGVALIFIYDYLDQSFRSLEDITDVLNIPYLGSIPVKAELKNYHLLAEQLLLLLKDKNINTVMFSSTLSKEGVTKTILSLGTYLSKVVGYKVLIIDANFKNSALGETLKISDNQGLTEISEGKITFEKAVKDLSNNLFVLSSGKEKLNPAIIFNSHIINDLLKYVKTKFDIILIDSAPLNETKDSVILAANCDGVVLVINEGGTRKQIVKVALAALLKNKVNVLGAILNNRTYPIPLNIYKRV